MNPKVLNKIKDYLIDLLHDEFGVSQHDLADSTPFDEVGIESAQAIKLVGKLSEKFEDVPPTLFFDYPTIEEMAHYFAEEHTEAFQVDEVPQFTEQEINHEPVIERAKEVKSKEPRSKDHMDIAIVGMSGRFPKSPDLDALWEVLKNGENCITEIPPHRWDYQPFFDPGEKKEGKMRTKWGGFVDGIEEFDPLFFKISKDDADTTDPQDRLVLQEACRALEDGGFTTEILQEQIQGEVGVFVGTMYLEYPYINPASLKLKDKRALSTCASGIPNRVSYFFNFSGPSVAMDTMCSSSLTTLNYACKALRDGECKLALAGGVNVSVHPHKYVTLARENFLSTEGLCRSFGEGGNGYVPSEGVGVFVVRPLEDAIENGDHIYAVIKGIGVNHGAKGAGYTVPSSKAQAKLLKRVISESGVSPSDISYVEAHGTGTSLGDPIEIEGLTQALGQLGVQSDSRSKIPIGSIKSNIGHCEAAAGAAGLAKLLMQMEKKKLVPSIHSQTLNPNIDWEKAPFRVQHQFEDWNVGESDRRHAIISAFGAGGSNAAVVLEEAMQRDRVTQGKVPKIFITSAMSREQLIEYVQKYIDYLEGLDEEHLTDFLYTLQVRRNQFAHRLAVVFTNLEDLVDKLKQVQSGKENGSGIYLNSTSKLKTIFKSNSSTRQFEQMMAGQNASIDESIDWIAELWCLGVAIDWKQYYKNMEPCVIKLPTYPFNRIHCWCELEPEEEIKGLPSLRPLIHENISTFDQYCFKSHFSGSESFIAEHVIQGRTLMPGAVSAEMCLEAASCALGHDVNQVESITWLRPILCENEVELLTRVEQREGHVVCSVESQSGDLLAQASVASQSGRFSTNQIAIEEFKHNFTTHTTHRAFYDHFKEISFAYGSSFCLCEQVWGSEKHFCAELKPSQFEQFEFVNPFVLDTMFQATIACGVGSEEALPFRVDQITFDKGFTNPHFICGKLRDEFGGGVAVYDLWLLDPSGKVGVEVIGFTVRGETKQSQPKEQVIEKELSVEDALALLQ